MASTSVPPTSARERFELHAATCRARRQQLVCSACCELSERAERAIRRAAGTVVSEAA